MSYECPICGSDDLHKYLRCNMPNCPDGRDRPFATEAELPITGVVNVLQPAPETWAGWTGRRLADGFFILAAIAFLKWLGFVVVVERCVR